MKTVKRLTLGILILLSFSFFPSAVVYNTSNGVINFRSDAPLEIIKASSNQLHGKLDGERKMFAFTVKINSFLGFNSPLQREHFNENYLESDRYPDAHFSGKIIEDVDFTKNGTHTVRAKGSLFIHGVSRERIIKSEITIKDGLVSIRSSFTVMLNEHNIPIPKVVNEKLASEIKVDVKADLSP